MRQHEPGVRRRQPQRADQPLLNRRPARASRLLVDVQGRLGSGSRMPCSCQSRSSCGRVVVGIARSARASWPGKDQPDHVVRVRRPQLDCGVLGDHVVRWRGDLGEAADPVLRITEPAERRQREARRGWLAGQDGRICTYVRRTDGGQDSRSGEESAWPAGVPARTDDVYSWYRRGLDLLGRGSPAAAAQLLQRAAEAEPGSRSVLEALGRAQFDTGVTPRRPDSFRQIVEASPSDDYAHFGLGLALARTENPAAAAEHLALAAAMRPDLPHYTDALRGVRATLRARAAPEPPASPPPAGDAPG